VIFKKVGGVVSCSFSTDSAANFRWNSGRQLKISNRGDYGCSQFLLLPLNLFRIVIFQTQTLHFLMKVFEKKFLMKLLSSSSSYCCSCSNSN